jgi:hypothetical protein
MAHTLEIHTNAPVNNPIYFLDRDGEPVGLDADGTYRASIAHRQGGNPVFTFVTGGGSGYGSLTVISDVVDDLLRDLLLFEADQSLIADIDPGIYVGDILRDDDPDWMISFVAAVSPGVTPAL